MILTNVFSGSRRLIFYEKTLTVNITLNPPFSTTCNELLSVQEQEDLWAMVRDISVQHTPSCPEGFYKMRPIAYDITYDRTLCCTDSPPCTSVSEPCDCYEAFPNDSYWGCCETYSLFLTIRYAYTGYCLTDSGSF